MLSEVIVYVLQTMGMGMLLLSLLPGMDQGISELPGQSVVVLDESEICPHIRNTWCRVLETKAATPGPPHQHEGWVAQTQFSLCA